MSKARNGQVDRFAEIFKALSNPNRLRIFLRLASCCAPGTACSTAEAMRACVGEVGKGLGIAPSTASHHIKELRRAGLIRMERCGQSIRCWVDPETVRSLSEFFGGEPLERIPGRGDPKAAERSNRNGE